MPKLKNVPSIIDDLSQDRLELRKKKISGIGLTYEEEQLLSDIEDIIADFYTKQKRKSISSRNRSPINSVKTILNERKEEVRKSIETARNKDKKAKLIDELLRLTKLDVSHKISNPLVDLNENKSDLIQDMINYLMKSKEEEKIGIINELGNQEYKSVAKKLSKKLNKSPKELNEIVVVLR